MYKFIYFFVVNLISFVVYGVDKRCAINGKRRVSERMLLSLSFVGGCVGAFFGMYIFHHKTKKLKFVVLVPFSLILWVIIFVFFC